MAADSVTTPPGCPECMACRAAWLGRLGPFDPVRTLEVDGDPVRDDPSRRRAVEEELHRGAPAGAVLHSPVIHVHPDEGVGTLLADPAIEPLRVRQRRLPVLEPVDDARLEVARHLADHRGAKIATDDIAAEGEGEAGVAEPPLAEVGPEMETVIGEGE